MTVVSTDAGAKANKKDLFGPQVDLTGMPIVPEQQSVQESKEKTRRELMWE